MSSIEEKLWEYIDGNSTLANREAIEKLIAADENYRRKYEELLAFNQEITADIELDEPPMAFTYHVMESIRTEYATQTPLKTRVSKTVMRLIGGFFVITLFALLVMMLGSIHWSAASSNVSNTTQFLDFKNLLSGNTLKVFIFFDTVLLLFLLDGFMRRRMTYRQS